MGVVAEVEHSKVVAGPIAVAPLEVAHIAVVVAAPTAADPAADHIVMVALVAIVDCP